MKNIYKILAFMIIVTLVSFPRLTDAAFRIRGKIRIHSVRGLVVVQHKGDTTGDGVSGNTVQITLARPIGWGNLIVVLPGSSDGSDDTVTQVVDNLGRNTFTQVTNARAVNTGGSGQVTDVWYAKNSVAGPVTITATFNNTGSNGREIFVFEVSGADISNPAQQVGLVNTGTATTTPLGGSVTTTNPDDFIASVIMSEGNISHIHSGNSFALGDIANLNGSAFKIAHTIGTYIPQWDQTSGRFCSSTVAFKAATPKNTMIIH